jgi:predicted CXXCH cytochrome family protein
MKNIILSPLALAAIVLTSLVVFIGGWMLLDNLLDPYHTSASAREEYQEVAWTTLMEQPVIFLGSNTCGTCHREIQEEWLQSAHSTVICEDCHDPGKTHVEDVVPMTVYTSSSLCLTCHASESARPATFPQVSADVHGGGASCLACHNPMHAETSSAPDMIHQAFVGLDCNLCHVGVNLKPLPDNHQGRPIDGCQQCHREEVQ